MLCFPKRSRTTKTNRILIVLLLSALMITAGPAAADTAPEVTPAPEDMQEADAIQYAEVVLLTYFDDFNNVVLGQISTYSRETYFGYYDASYDEPIWIINFIDPDNTSDIYQVKLTRQGGLLSYCAPGSIPYLADEDEMTDITLATPGPDDMSEEDVLDFAMAALCEIGDYETRIDQITAEAYFLYSDRYCSGWEPVWIVYFYEDGVLLEKLLLGYDGSYIDLVSADKQFSNTQRNGEPSYIDISFNDLGFWDMTHEERAAFSAEWIPYVEAYAQTHPYFPAPGDLFYAATRCVYGVPGDDDLTQDEATQIALSAIAELGANEATLSQRSVICLFDVTNPDQPLWKLFIYRADVSDETTSSNDGDRHRYRVVIQSLTGEIVEAYQIESDMSYLAYRF